jgi:hypothetical protein
MPKEILRDLLPLQSGHAAYGTRGVPNILYAVRGKLIEKTNKQKRPCSTKTDKHVLAAMSSQ